MANSTEVGTVKLIRKTDKAILVQFDEDDTEMWIPNSVVHEDSEVFAGMDGDTGELVVMEWWAKKEGLV